MRICTIFEQVHILNSKWINEYWYLFIVLIGIVISIVYYVHHKKKAFRQSLLLLLTLFLFSFSIHQLESPNLEDGVGLNGLEQFHEDHFGTSPDYLGKGVERFYDFIRKFI